MVERLDREDSIDEHILLGQRSNEINNGLHVFGSFSGVEFPIDHQDLANELEQTGYTRAQRTALTSPTPEQVIS